MMKFRLPGAAIAALLCVGVLSAQQPAPQAPEPPAVTFRVEVNYVEVDAFVTDAAGNIVSDLTIEDFEVLEDGRAQKVTAFSLVDIPVERAERPLFADGAIEPDVQTNENSEGRIYLIVLDDLHVDFTLAPRVRTALRRFVERNFGENDLAAVVYTGGRAADSQDFTNRRSLLLKAIDKFTGRKLRSATLERLQNLRLDPSGNVGPGDDPSQMERAHNARTVMSTVRQLAEFMAGVRGRRKALLFISEGIDYNIYDVMGQSGATASSVVADTYDAIAAATRGNVAIYGIDPRGLSTGDGDLIEVSSTFPDQGVGLSSALNELRLAQDSLRVLAAETGGFAAVNQNDLNTAFDRIVRENSTYYLLGYYSSNERRDGRVRKLQVRVKRPGLQVRSRTSYVAPRGRAPRQESRPGATLHAAIGEALGSPLPVSGLPMRVFAAPYKGTAPDAAIALGVEIDVANLDFVEKGGTFNEQIEVTYTATDASGKVYPGERHRMTLTMKPDTYERARTHGFRVLTQVNLRPGRYQLRVAAGNANGKAGSVLYDLEVPDFYKAPFALSAITLTSANAAHAPTIKPRDPLGDFLPGPPTAAREFRVGDEIALFGEVYENLRNAPPHVIDIRTELRDEGGRVVRQTAEERSSSELQGGTGGYGFVSRLALNDIAPGLYVVHVEARSRAGNQESVARDIQIRVR